MTEWAHAEKLKKQGVIREAADVGVVWRGVVALLDGLTTSMPLGADVRCKENLRMCGQDSPSRNPCQRFKSYEDGFCTQFQDSAEKEQNLGGNCVLGTLHIAAYERRFGDSHSEDRKT
jgi:hypothetical protein